MTLVTLTEGDTMFDDEKATGSAAPTRKDQVGQAAERLQEELERAEPGDSVQIPSELVPESVRHIPHMVIKGPAEKPPLGKRRSVVHPEKPSDEELARRFTYQPPDADRTALHRQVDAIMLRLARQLRDLTPHGRAQALALTALEEARMRANQAIAIGE